MRAENWNFPNEEIPLWFVPQEELRNYSLDSQIQLISFACRLNILSMIKRAGSGHIGSSFSAIDICLASKLFLKNHSSQNGIFFSSKGHDAPAIYAAGHSFGELSDESLLTLRRFEGLPGHPEIHIPGVPTNTGSLGMGISKSKGFILGARNAGKPDPIVITLLGDGELQEGQIWESMPGAFRDNMKTLIAIVDGNKLQSDTWTEQVLPVGDLESRVTGCGWEYFECDGHDIAKLQKILSTAVKRSRPVLIYAHTVKSSGVPFMSNFAADSSFYRYHSGAPSDEDYSIASKFLRETLASNPTEEALKSLARHQGQSDSFLDKVPRDRPPSLIQAWNHLLKSACSSDSKIVVLDADLSFDTGTYGISTEFPTQYVQCGIAEQDMVSMAGTLALSGSLPIVHSFASFLTTRSLEQIFNNTTENSQIIYAGFLAGIVPTGPGHSHQAVIDVGIISAIPNIKIFEPACTTELELAFNKSLSNQSPSYIRINSIGLIESPSNSGQFSNLLLRREGDSIAIVTSGATMTQIALETALHKNISVYTRYEINRPLDLLEIEELGKYKLILVLENFTPCKSNFEIIKDTMEPLHVRCLRIGIDEIPRNGDQESVLKWHKLDANSICDLIDRNLI